MKILELRFKNLNSLYGEWVIDFTDAEYASNGIFALTGPTGAGKSTILDAICLALYGATPRLGKITKSGNEIMSRQTGECYAEVLFESQDGRFRCHWEQRRARTKADGKLQDQEHQIADAAGNLIETKKSLVGDVIVEKTGMDFDRFTRSILLAQGGFDTFLKADAEQKSLILEQITGTGIYSEISKRVHERRREENEKLNILMAETSGIVILEPAEEQEVQEDLQAKQKQESELADQSTTFTEAIAWLTSIEELKKEIHSLSGEADQLKSDTEAFKPDRTKLEQANKAASLEGTYVNLTSLRKLQVEDQTAFTTLNTSVPEIESSANKQAKVLKNAEELSQQAKEELRSSAPLIQKVRSLDQKIGEQTKTISEMEGACSKEEAQIRIAKEARGKELEKRTVAEETLEATEKYLNENAQDEWLVSGLAGVEEQFNSLLAKKIELEQKETLLIKADEVVSDAEKELDKASRQCKVKRKELKLAAEQVEQRKEALRQLLGEKLLREYRSEKESLLREMGFIRKIEELEHHRAKLEDGKPCPLCGSNHHPFAEGNVPAPDSIEQRIESLTALIDTADEHESAIKDLQQAESVAQKNLNQSEKLETEAINAKNNAEISKAALKEAITELQAGFADLTSALAKKLQPLGVTELPESEVESLLVSLQSRLKAWQEKQKQKSEIEKQLAGIDSEVNRIKAVIETQVQALTEKQKKLERLKLELTDAIDERKHLYGDKNPDEEEKSLQTTIENAEVAEKTAGNLNDELQKKLTTARTQIESLKERIEQRTPELKSAEIDFLEVLTPAGFADESAFLSARLPQAERESLNARAKTLENAETELQAKQKDRETRLAKEIAKKVTDKTLAELEPEFRKIKESLKELADAIAGIKHKLNENAQAKERIKEKQEAIAIQKKECHRWEQLHDLIGSADGKKYRSFAQGLTFELMVSYANRQLTKMTDRYLLIRDEQLGLNVIDNYQAGEIRSTKNLSGGESFIISLTLALGLSKMASQKVRVDSLFLDEGFGTLDEEALETALETLSGLQQDGKLIGIISHVSALKERISTQINIKPTSGGRSTLSGPGCKRVDKREVDKKTVDKIAAG